MMPWLILALFAIALLLLYRSSARQRSAGLPGGRIVYSDTRTWGPVEQALYDPVWDLTGKPDYLIRQGRMIVPVEVKSGRTPAAPYDSHIYQLAAYCLLVDRVMRVRPEYGLIHYPGRTYRVDYTQALERSLKDLLDEMRAGQRRQSLDRSHDETARCRKCGYGSICDQRL
ncbi:MAG TPA: Dna2/Cas4 domain-containing protein [Anaerolineales bacterium]|nr:Dna2/Cas4 domain-containing protein [Anaerolineales bacterium]